MTEERLKRAEELAAELQGTCKSLHDALDEGEEDDRALMSALDDLVFCCEECSWWSEVSEMADCDGQFCLDCRGDDDD